MVGKIDIMRHYLKTLLIYFYLTQTNSFTIVFKKKYNNLLNSRKNTAYQETDKSRLQYASDGHQLHKRVSCIGARQRRT